MKRDPALERAARSAPDGKYANTVPEPDCGAAPRDERGYRKAGAFASEGDGGAGFEAFSDAVGARRHSTGCKRAAPSPTDYTRGQAEAGRRT